MKKMNLIYMTLINLIVFVISFSQCSVFASMADFTDKQADEKYNEQIKEQQKEIEERVNKSSNNYLKSLSIDGYEIMPSFDKQTVNYKVEKEIHDSSITIQAETEDEKASVSKIGEFDLVSGENNITIDVTAENGTVRSYYINVTKKIKRETKLKSLKIIAFSSDNEVGEIELETEFNSDIFMYDCSVNSTIDKINVEAYAEDENAKIEITGNEKLKEGLNEIFIKLNPNTDDEVIYKINVKKEKSLDVENNINEKNYKTLILIFAGAFILIVLTVRISRNKKHRRKH